jgi:hypothetical protein
MSEFAYPRAPRSEKPTTLAALLRDLGRCAFQSVNDLNGLRRAGGVLCDEFATYGRKRGRGLAEVKLMFKGLSTRSPYQRSHYTAVCADAMRKHLRTPLISILAAGAALASGVDGSFAADSISTPFPPSADAPNSVPFLTMFQQNYTPVSQSSSISFSSGDFGLKMNSDVRDNTRTDGKSFMDFFSGDNSKWQQNQVGYINVEASLGENLRVKTRVGASSYDASRQFFDSLAQKKSAENQRAARFLGVGPASGSAALTRVEEDFLRAGDFKVTGFQEFSHVSSYFEDLRFSDKAFRKQTRDDPFSSPDRQTGKYGVSLVQGSSGVMVSQSSISDISGSASSFYSEQRFNSTAWLGVRDMTKDFWNSNGSVLGNLVPSSVWVGYSEGSVRQNVALPTLAAVTGGATSIAAIPNGIAGAASTGATTTAVVTNSDAGLSWQWGDAYANLSAWHSQSSALWSGNGANVSIGVNKTKWSASAYASLTRSSNQDTSNNSDSHSFNSGASFSVPLENWPDLTLAFDVGTYGGVYTTWDGKDNGRIVRGGVALDFSKYLIERPGQKLQLFYYARNESYDSQWGTLNSNYLTIDHVFGTVFRTWW